LYDQILWVLKNYTDSRNSDFILRWKLWEAFYPHLIHQDGLRWFVYKEDEARLPNQDDIKRIRAHIQNDEKLYPPTDWAVAKQRKWLEQEWRAAMGYPAPIETEAKLTEDRFNKTVKSTSKLL